MSDENQIEIPPSFLALFTEPGRHRPNAPRAQIAQRYELCEDMAQLLTEPARTLLFSLGIAESDVLQRCRQGLLVEDSAFSEVEADWVMRRLAELLDWPTPAAG